jgi:hypothetical protein
MTYSPLESYLYNSIQYCLPTRKEISSFLESNQKTLWLPQLFYAFRKHDQYISDVFIIVTDDALDILLDVNELHEQLCWFSFKQTSCYSFCYGR